MEKLMLSCGAVGSLICALFGGWSGSMSTLCIFMAIDFVTALVVAGIFHESPKTENGGLESNAAAKGLFRKIYVLVLVLVAHRIDLEFGTSYLRDGVCIAFIAAEAISIVENCGLMGLPVPAKLIESIEILKSKGCVDDH